MTRDLLVLADDTTGALEAGALLAGVRCEVLLAGEAGDAGVVVTTTETRQAEPGLAAARVLQTLRRFPARRVYKKTDSTLRGPLAAELAALCAFAGSGGLLFVPAYPMMGRTVEGGMVRIHGRPLGETEFGRESSVLRLLEAGGVRGARVCASPLELRAGEFVVGDASSEEEVAGWARASATLPPGTPLAGPAGFLRHLYAGRATAAMVRAEKLLWVCGSLHPASRAAARRAAEFGPVLATPRVQSAEALSTLAAEAARAIRAEKPDAVMIFGGDTAAALFRALGIERLEPLGELLPGIPASRAGARPVFITKAGGFGSGNTAAEIAAALGGS